MMHNCNITGASWQRPKQGAPKYTEHRTWRPASRAIVSDGIERALVGHAVEAPPSKLAAQRDWIDECYAGDTVADFVAALRGHDAGPANDAANVIATRSPSHWR
jgi:enoyl-CoA hydratase